MSEVARARLRPLLRLARERGAFINFDMEQYRYKDLVHRTFEDAVLDPEFRDYPHVGIVVQAYLRDAHDDVGRLQDLAERRGTPFSIRLVKGAYWDEERIVAAQNSWPVPVFEEKAETDRSFEACTDALLKAWPHLRPAIGSHNPRSVAQAIVKARDARLPDGSLEFQTLYGMAEGLRTAIAEAGYRTRVYTPVGEVIPGMAYLVRRLLENTSNQAWFNAGVTLASTATVPQPERVSLREQMAFRNAAPAAFFEPEARELMQAALARARRGFGATYPLLIAGSRISDRPAAEVRYPADPGEVIGRVAQASRADVDAAVDAAREAFPAWRDLPAEERTEVLHRAADLLERDRFDLAAVMVFESAKPWAEADGDVCEAIDYLRYYAGHGERLSQAQPLNDPPGEENEYFYEGRGVTAVIAPWNFPLAIITGMSAGALAGGNAPSSSRPPSRPSSPTGWSSCCARRASRAASCSICRGRAARSGRRWSSTRASTTLRSRAAAASGSGSSRPRRRRSRGSATSSASSPRWAARTRSSSTTTLTSTRRSTGQSSRRSGTAARSAAPAPG